MSDDNGAETCPRCGRAECPRMMGIMAMRLTMDAFNNCERHAVDWRAETLRLRAEVAHMRRTIALLGEELGRTRRDEAPATPAAGAVAETVIEEDPEGWWQRRARRDDEGNVRVETYRKRYENGCPVGDWFIDIDDNGEHFSPAAWSRLVEVMNGGK